MISIGGLANEYIDVGMANNCSVNSVASSYSRSFYL